jgi:hypothetical protein
MKGDVIITVTFKEITHSIIILILIFKQKFCEHDHHNRMNRSVDKLSFEKMSFGQMLRCHEKKSCQDRRRRVQLLSRLQYNSVKFLGT